MGIEIHVYLKDGRIIIRWEKIIYISGCDATQKLVHCIKSMKKYFKKYRINIRRVKTWLVFGGSLFEIVSEANSKLRELNVNVTHIVLCIKGVWWFYAWHDPDWIEYAGSKVHRLRCILGGRGDVDDGAMGALSSFDAHSGDVAPIVNKTSMIVTEAYL